MKTDPYVLPDLDGDWAARGLCRFVDPELFFGISEESVVEAKEICAVCPVRQDCLSWSITNAVQYGVWGGQDQDQRRPAIRQHQQAIQGRLVPQVSDDVKRCSQDHPQGEGRTYPDGRCRACQSDKAAAYRATKNPVERVTCGHCKRNIALRQGLINRHNDTSSRVQCAGSFQVPHQVMTGVSA